MTRRLMTGAVLLAMTSVSPSIAYTGRVMNRAGNPVADAKVAVRNTTLSALTSADGTFSVGGSVVMPKSKSVRASGIRVMRTGTMTTVQLDNPGAPVRVARYMVDGRLIASAVCSPDLPQVRFRASGGMTVVTIAGVRGSQPLRLAPFSAVTIQLNPAGFADCSPAKTAGKKSAAEFDTILITKNCFVSITRQVRKTESNLGDFILVNVDSGMVLVPAADSSFQMGNPAGESNEKPVHTVSFTHDFYMDTVEVTQGNYRTLLNQRPWTLNTYSDIQYDTADNKPAVYLTWYDAVIYCNARSRRDGLDTVYAYLALGDSAPGAHCQLTDLQTDFSKRGYRLPTEAEWEYACRSRTTTTFYWGNDTVGIGNNAVYRINSYDLGTTSPFYGVNPAGTKLPNAFNLRDMAGNVAEMCYDFFNGTFYAESLPSDPRGPSTGTSRVCRGGSWKLIETFLTSSRRSTINVSMNTFSSDIGFRCVITADK